MRQNSGRSALRGCANSEPKSVPAHSTPVLSSRTEKVIALGADAMPNSSKSAMSFGYVRSL